MSRAENPCAGNRPRAPTAASNAQTARTARSACVRSARRPHNGPEMSRIAVPLPNRIPRCSGASPRAWKNAGMNGDATPNAAYISAKSATSRPSAPLLPVVVGIRLEAALADLLDVAPDVLLHLVGNRLLSEPAVGEDRHHAVTGREARHALAAARDDAGGLEAGRAGAFGTCRPPLIDFA